MCIEPQSVVDATVRCGELLSASVDVAGEVDLITFTGNTNEVVALTLVETSNWGGLQGRNDARVTVLAPSGTEVITFDSSAQQQLTLPETGMYLIRLNANNLVSTGSYNLGLECIEPQSVVDATVSCGGAVVRLVGRRGRS